MEKKFEIWFKNGQRLVCTQEQADCLFDRFARGEYSGGLLSLDENDNIIAMIRIDDISFVMPYIPEGNVAQLVE